ncbi:MAG: RNA degradosome polyphosphate kinase, partial [Sphingomicrobium sp.]
MDSAEPIRAGPADPAPEVSPREPLYFNRELSWLAFNQRVLEEASNATHPLLERLRFLSISGSNLDEFFMVRVAGLKAHETLGVGGPSADGLTPSQQLAAINVAVDRLVSAQHEVWNDIRAALAEVGMEIVGDEPLDQTTTAWIDSFFAEQIFPLLTPQAIDPAHPFPFIPNRGFSLIFELRRGRAEPVRQLVMMPTAIPRFIRVPGERSRYIALETLIRRKTDYLFPRYDVLRGGAFRVIRDSDIEIEEEAEDLVRYFRTAIKRRRRGRVVRLELEA